MTKKSYALITGASSGIGAAVAKKLAQNNHNLILIARRKDKLHLLKEELERNFEIEVLCFALDVTDIPRLNTLFKKLEDLNIDIAINNAGLALGKDSIENYDWTDFNTMIEVNVKAFTRVAQLVIPFLKKSQGHIINISSIAGVEAYEGGSVYCGTKAFVKMVSKSMRLDLAGTGVRVTDIAPGAVDTEFSTVRFKGDKTKADNVYLGFTPLFAEDIAETILFALNRPPHVNIEYILITPTAQAGATRFHRS